MKKAFENKLCLPGLFWQKYASLIKCLIRLFFSGNAIRKLCFTGLITENIVDHGPPLNRLSPHSRSSAICSEISELTSLHLNFCDSCLFVGGGVSSCGENCIQSTLEGLFSTCVMISISITILSVMVPRLLLRQKRDLFIAVVCLGKVYLKMRRKPQKQTHKSDMVKKKNNNNNNNKNKTCLCWYLSLWQDCCYSAYTVFKNSVIHAIHVDNYVELW